MRYPLITTLLIKVLLISAVSAQLVEVHIENPGKAGMVSAIGASDYTPDMLRYALNVTYRDGRLRPRMSVDIYGGTNIAIYGASGYYDPYAQTKNIVGVEAHATYAMGQVAITDTFETSLQDNDIGGTLYPWRSTYHDWTPHRGFLIHADGKTPPFLVTTLGGFKMSDSLADSAGLADTLGYLPRTLPLNMEAPGQLRPIVLDSTGGLRGIYQYALAFHEWRCNGATTPDSMYADSAHISQIGPISVPVYPNNQQVLITLFDNYPPQKSDTDNASCQNRSVDSTIAWLLRRKVDGENAWRVRDTLYYGDGDTVVYVDTMSDSLSLLYPGGYTKSGDTTDANDLVVVPTPGSFARGFIKLGTGGAVQVDDFFAVITIDTSATTHFADVDSLYATAYSYYDPITGMESPMGPLYYGKIDTVSSDGVDTLFSVPLAKGLSGANRPSHIRIWQAVAGDSATFYLLFEGRANHFTKGDDTLWFNSGGWSDVDIQVGLDTADFTCDTIFTRQIPYDIGGDVIVRSSGTFVEGLTIPASDIAKAHDKFYAIGDPEFPNRIYYSRIDTAWVWPVINFYRIDESVSDEFVALEEFRGMLYAFKHNSIWVKPDGDAEWDMYWGRTVDPDIVWRQLTAELGAASRNTVLKHGDAIYFMTPSADVYVIGVDGLHEISGPVANRMDSTFRRRIGAGQGWVADYTAVKNYANVFSLNNEIKFQNDSTGWFLTYNTKLGTWSHETIRFDSTTMYIPLGSFAYDSLSGSAGFGQWSDIMFVDTTIGLAYQKRASIVGDWTATGGPTNFSFQWVAEFPLGGDGVGLWAPQVFKPTFFPRTGAWLRFDGYDEDGTRMSQDSVYLTTSRASGRRFHITPSNGVEFPFMRVWSRGSGFSQSGGDFDPGGDASNSSDPTVYANIIEFDKIVFFIENVGQREVE